MNQNRLGVIDSVSAGLNVVAQRIWVIMIPVLLDLWYWRGPRLSIAPLFSQIEQFVVRSATATSPDTPINIEMFSEIVEWLGQQFNLFSLLSAALLHVPSLMANGSSANASIREIHSWPAMIGLTALLVLAGLAIGCLYLTLIAQGLVQQSLDPRELAHRIGAMLLRVVGFVVLVFFFAISLAVPFVFLTSLLTFVSREAAAFFMGIFYMSIIWLGVYLYFVAYAILLNRVGPLRAIWNSANVVARNYWSALGLLILIVVLNYGLSLVWQRLGELHPIAMIIGIAGNAFVGSGLIAAGLLFYRDRYRRWQKQTLGIGD